MIAWRTSNKTELDRGVIGRMAAGSTNIPRLNTQSIRPSGSLNAFRVKKFRFGLEINVDFDALFNPESAVGSGVKSVETLVVGAGAIGIELAVVLQAMGRAALHLEAGALGQTICGYPLQARFFSSPERIAIAGMPLTTLDQSKASREDYLGYLRGVVQHFKLKIQTQTRVQSVRRIEAGQLAATAPRFEVELEGRHGTSGVACRHLVLAIGDMHLERRLEIPGEDLPQVRHHFVDPHPYFDRDVLIVGGRNSAVEAALRCHRAGARVTISYRRDALPEAHIKYWLLPEINALIRHGVVKFLPNTVPVAIRPGEVDLVAVESSSEAPEDIRRAPEACGDVERQTITTDEVLLLTGYRQDQTLFDQLGLVREGRNHAPVLDPETQATSVPGCYVAGTAAAGTQNDFRLFIENTHIHAARIAAAITGEEPPMALINNAAQTYGLAES